MLSSFRNVIRRNGKLLCSLNDVSRLTTIKTSLTFHDRQLYHKVAVRMMSSNESNKNENDKNDKNDNNTNADNNNGDANNNSSEQELISKLQKEVKDLKDQVIRSYAEEENVRRIAKRDVENAKSYANEKMAKAMLDVADNLDRALAAIPIEERTSSSSTDSSENNTLSTFIEGITMTEKNLQKIFVQFNIIKYGQIGDVFNPSLHDALFQIPDASKEPNTIGQVLKSGYKLKDRVIRAAQVGTVVKPQ
jgi:molecular chaperone GrpE